ncbi:MAG: hypothetical protein AB7F83_11910 [Lysobacterales bacterium]
MKLIMGHINMLTKCAMLVVFAYGNLCYASGNIVSQWARVDFTTQANDRVIIESSGDELDNISLSIQGNKTVLIGVILEDLGMPNLNAARLVYSFGGDPESVESSQILEIPLFEFGENGLARDIDKLVRFVFENGTFVRRELLLNNKRVSVLHNSR